MKPVIRAAGMEDIARMHRIRMAVRENRLSDPERITEDSYVPYVRDGSAWVAELDAKIAGFAALDVAGAGIWALFVDPAAQGCGIGKALHERMLQAAAALGLERLSLSTAPGTRAELFYAAAGWTSDGPTDSGEIRFVRELRPPGKTSRSC